jgi:methyl-accepting chemotaxis protein
LQDLQNVNVVKDGTSALSSAASTVRSNVNALAESAQGQVKDEAEALRNSLDQLSSAVQNVRSGGVTPVTDALSSVRHNGNALVQQLNNLKC